MRTLLKMANLKVALLFVIFTSPSHSQVLDTNIDINPNNHEFSVNFENPGGVIKTLRIRVYDPDSANEGRLYVNDQGPITLFPGASDLNDGATVDLDLSLNAAQQSYFQDGNNVLRFTNREMTRTVMNEEGEEVSETYYEGTYRIEQIIGIGEPTKKSYAAVFPEMNSNESPLRKKALELYKRLAGINAPIDSPKIKEMEKLLLEGKLLSAARVATKEPGFYNFVVRDFGAKMSTKAESVSAPLSDMVATFIGVTRDQTDARELLTANMFYMANSSVPVANNILNDVVTSNRHYQQLEDDGYDLGSVLTRVNTQYLRGPNGQLQKAVDSAGVITSRAFMEAHAIAGTNRRMVEFTFRQFTCNPLDKWADASAPDIRIGQDVDRFPGGDGNKFQTNCKSCHSVMDGMRGAFARFNFEDGFIKYTDFYSNGEGANATPRDANGVVNKMTRNSHIFPAGYKVVDSTWKNFAKSPANQKLFGWREFSDSGSGVHQLGKIVANSKAFSQCMVKRVFKQLCKRDVAVFEQDMVEQMAKGFEADQYKLKGLFERVAIRSECLGW